MKTTLASLSPETFERLMSDLRFQMPADSDQDCPELIRLFFDSASPQTSGWLHNILASGWKIAKENLVSALLATFVTGFYAGWRLAKALGDSEELERLLTEDKAK